MVKSFTVGLKSFLQSEKPFFNHLKMDSVSGKVFTVIEKLIPRVVKVFTVGRKRFATVASRANFFRSLENGFR